MAQAAKTVRPKRERKSQPKVKLELVNPTEKVNEDYYDPLPPFDEPILKDYDQGFDDLTPEEEDQLDDVLGEAEHYIIGPKVIPSSPPVNGTLVVHCGANRVTREDLALIALPEATATFQPIHHARLVDELEEALAFRHISIVRSEFAVTPDGMRLFGLLEVNAEYEGVRLAIGLRNANDRSMRLGMVAGYRCFVCDNMSLSGDFKPMLAKHSKNFDLIESLSLGVDRIQRGFEPLKRAIDFKRLHPLDDDRARLMIYRAFMEQKFPVTLMKRVHSHYFVPEYEEFKPRTVWSMENAFTSSFKELKPVRQYEMTARLGKYLVPYTQAF